MGNLEDRVDDIEDSLEELEETVDRMKENGGQEDDEEDGNKTLYVYVYFVEEEKESLLLGTIQEKKHLLIYEDGEGANEGYTVPNDVATKRASLAAQCRNLIHGYGFDCYEEISRHGETEDAIYYRVRVPKEVTSEVEEGIWVSERELDRLVNDWAAKEYIQWST